MEGPILPNGNSSEGQKKLSGVKRGLLMVAGTISLGLGCLGVFLPILPTTPFLLLSAACYYRSSERMHSWMLSNRLFGSYIRNYQEGRGLSLRSKIFTLCLLWAVIGYSALFMLDILVVKVLLFLVAVGVSIHVIKIPTLSNNKNSNFKKY